MFEVRYFINGVNRSLNKPTKVEAIKAALDIDEKGNLPMRICKTDIHGNNRGAIWDLGDFEDTNSALMELHDLLEKENKKSVN